MKRKLILLFFFVFFLFFILKNSNAASGCCSWHGGVCGCDSKVGRQVCCDGTYSPSCRCYFEPPRPTPIVFPYMTATWQSNPKTDQTFSLSVTLNDSSPTQYSAVISKCKGCDPGPLIDFYSNKFTYHNLKTGQYYLNVKKSVNGYWSNVAYWTIDIPNWTNPTPTIIPPVLTTQTQTQDSVQSLLLLIAFFVLLSFGLSIIYGLYRLVRWFIDFSKENDWVWSALFYGGIILYWIISSLIPAATKSSPTDIKRTKYTCNCSKTCPNLSCDEAYFQLNNCGCSVRDGDGDGVPCENVCN